MYDAGWRLKSPFYVQTYIESKYISFMGFVEWQIVCLYIQEYACVIIPRWKLVNFKSDSF